MIMDAIIKFSAAATMLFGSALMIYIASMLLQKIKR